MKRAIACAAIGTLIALGAAAAQAASAERGRQKSQTCAACHGADGNSATPDFPRLAGQYEDYMLRALLDYKSGQRKNPIMAAQVANLSKQDMADLAAFFAGQKGLFQKR